MREEKELIAYQGKEFTIEWYFDGNGRSIAFEYSESLKEEEQIKLYRLFKLIGDLGEIKDKTKFNSEGDKIYAFKPQPYRFLCFFVQGKKIIVTNGFCKKQQKLPKNEKEKALKYKSDYENRTKRDEYYD